MGCRLSLFLMFSVWGFFLFSRPCLPVLFSPSSSLIPLVALMVSSLPLFIALYLVLSLSQGLNLCLWSYRNIGMTAHALPWFVSQLACWLAHWLAWSKECVHENVPYIYPYTDFFSMCPSFHSHHFTPFRDVWLVFCCYIQCQPVIIEPA